MTSRWCLGCEITKPLDSKHFRRASRGRGFRSECRKCESKKHKLYMSKHPEKLLFLHAKDRAKHKGWPFSISEADVVIPKTCPVLGIPLVSGIGKLHDNSPTVERVDSSKGYVPGNVLVVSYKANRAKNNCSLSELETIVRFYQNLLSAKAAA